MDNRTVEELYESRKQIVSELKKLYESYSIEELNISLTSHCSPTVIEIIQLELSKRKSDTTVEEHSLNNTHEFVNKSSESIKIESKANFATNIKSQKMELKILMNKFSATVLLLFGVIVFGLITYLVSENPFGFSDTTCIYIIYGTISFIFLTVMTFEIYTSIFFPLGKWSNSLILIYGLPFFLSNITTAILVQHQHFKYYQINFWLCLISWVYLYITTRSSDFSDYSKHKPVGQNKSIQFENIIFALTAAWTISSVYITLGITLFDYGKLPIYILQEIHSLLDIRINLAIIIVVLIAIKSIVFVLQNKKVEVKPLFKLREQVSGSKNKLNLFLQVLTVFLNISINFLGSFGNIFYKAFATVVIYLFYIGGEIFNSFSALLKNSVNLLFYLLELIAVLSAFYSIYKTSLYLLQYLRENTWINSYIPLILVIGYSIVITVCMISINYFRSMSFDIKEKRIERNIEGFNKILARDIQALPYLIAIIWVIGILIFFVAKIDFLHFKTFKTFGILATSLSSVVFIGFIIYLYNNFSPSQEMDKSSINKQTENKNHSS